MDEIKIKSWILRGSQRRVVFKIFKEGMIPAQIWEEAKKINPKITRNNVSDVLKEFRDKNIIECVNPYEKKGRIYMFCKNSKNIQEELFSENNISNNYSIEEKKALMIKEKKIK